MSTFFALGIAMDDTAQLVVDVADLDRTITVTGNGIAVGYDDTVFNTSGILLLNDVPYVVVLPAGHQLWAKGPVGTSLRIFVGGRS